MTFVIGVFNATSVHAEPLTPLTPAEIRYLEQLRQVFAAKHDSLAFNSDGELLDDGRYVCHARDHGLVPGASPDAAAPVFVGQGLTFYSPALIQVAFATLCPK
jgi:hypothetical protein